MERTVTATSISERRSTKKTAVAKAKPKVPAHRSFTSTYTAYKDRLFRLRAGWLVLWGNRWFRIALLCAPIVLYYLPLLLTGNKIAAGDEDYYTALYAAFRRIVLDYHQFPWWDPWIAGGVPLFGNIQFGLISIPTPFVLLFGAPFGLKVSLVAYGIIGFFGVRRLLSRYFNTPQLRAVAIAYIFIFCGFFAARARMGHFTFPLAALTPWILYYCFYITERRAWLKLGIWLSLLILSSPHYIAIMTLYIVAGIVAWKAGRAIIQTQGVRPALRKYQATVMAILKAAAMVAALTAYRMFYVLDFFRDHQRALDISSEKYTTLHNVFQAIWWNPNFVTTPDQGLTWGWGEIETYIGFTTLLALCLIGVAALVYYRKNFRQQFSRSVIIMVVVLMIFLLVGLGDFARFAPYKLAQHLPLFSAMRVATRWVFWVAGVVLLILAAYRGRRFARTITCLCIIAAVELLIRYPVLISGPYFITTYQYRSATAPFYEERYNRVPRPQYANDVQYQKDYWFDQNLYESTQNNIGQVFASDSLLYKAALGETIRCGVGAINRMPCPFVRSHNAVVTYWSPNTIKLKRTAPGPIELDMNPGSGWRVNDTYPFRSAGSVSATAQFIFGDEPKPANTYTVTYAPRLSPAWINWKLTHIF